MSRTRIKVCGLTRVEDAQAAAHLGADALGLVFYAPSPRYVSFEAAARISRSLPPFIARVGLFVNSPAADVQACLAQVPLDVLQFHGEEDAAYCRQFNRPYLKAARMRPELDLVEYAARYPDAQALLLDAYVEGYGGGGEAFDWSMIPTELPLPRILAGGLTPENVEAAVCRVRPWAVDVSSGVESSKGIKDADKITAFIAGVRQADARLKHT